MHKLTMSKAVDSPCAALRDGYGLDSTERCRRIESMSGLAGVGCCAPLSRPL